MNTIMTNIGDQCLCSAYKPNYKSMQKDYKQVSNKYHKSDNLDSIANNLQILESVILQKLY